MRTETHDGKETPAGQWRCLWQMEALFTCPGWCTHIKLTDDAIAQWQTDRLCESARHPYR